MPKLLPLLLLLFSCTGHTQNTILWEVKDTIHHKTSYLLGTYHQLGNHFVDGHPIIAEKLLGSELAIFESLSETDITTSILARPASEEYKKELGRKAAKQLDELAQDWKYPLAKLRPAEILVKLQQSYFETHCGNVIATDSFQHFDRYLLHLARKNDLSTLGLETDSIQIAFINQGMGAGGWAELSGKITFWLDAHRGKKDEEALCAFTHRYRNLDLDYGLAEPCQQSELVTVRNENWMDILPEKLRQQNCFVAVGLFHLFQDCGLIEQLRALGFQVDAIPMDSRE